MVTAEFIEIEQDGNGGAAVKAGNHASQKGGGGGGGGGAAPESASAQKPLGDAVPDTFDKGLDFNSDVGNLYIANPDQIDPGSAKADAQMVRDFKAGKINATPAFGVEQRDGSYRPADPRSARLMASARAAGAQVNVIGVKRGDGSLAAASTAATGRPLFARVAQGRGLSEAGNLMTVPASDIKGGKVTASQRSIDRAARQVRNKGGRAILPVAVRATGQDSYQVVGGANALAIARRANVDPWIYVVSD